LYKTKVFLGILSRIPLVGPCIVVVAGERRCNHRCIFCKWFSPMEEEKNQRASPNYHLDMDTYRRLIRELKSLGTKVIVIGNNEEPFMDTQLIEKIKYTKECGLRCFVITNGSLLNEEKVETIVDFKLDYLNVSLNAGTAKTYRQINMAATEETFERIISNISLIESLKEKNHTIFPHVRLSMVVCNRNYREVAEFVGLCQEIGVKNVAIKRLISASKEMADELELSPLQEEETKNYLSELLNVAKEKGFNLDLEWSEWTNEQKTVKKGSMPCYYGWLFSVIDSDGSVYPCCFPEKGLSSSFGNIKQEGFSQVWFSKEYRAFRGKSKSIGERRDMGFQCNQPSCFFNNKQVDKVLHKPYLYF
jgi:radical SAM protein with 4Fe4S-binding SPASM domain